MWNGRGISICCGQLFHSRGYGLFHTTHRHLYYTYLNQIISVGMDGQNSSPIYTSQCPTTTISITLDPLTNTLFWVDCGGSLIRWMDVTNPSLTGNFSTAPLVPYRITALNDTFYWTVQSGGGGAVYKVDQPRSGLSQAPANIWTSSTIIPYAVRVSVDGFSCEHDVIVVHHVDIYHVDMCVFTSC